MALTAAYRLGDRVAAVGVLAGIAPPGLADHTDLAERDLFDLAAADPAALRGMLAQVAAGLREDTAATAQQLLGGGLVESDLAVFGDPVFGAMMMATLAESARHDLAGYAEDIACFLTDWTPSMRAVQQRVHPVHGTADGIAPVRHGRAIAAGLPGAVLTEVEAGHLSVLVPPGADHSDAGRLTPIKYAGGIPRPVRSEGGW